MILEKIAIFIIFLGPLIFFHELGHYFFARLFGVRVEVFSMGFGPKIFKFKKGDTEYAISLIPLGGYIKMFGDDPLEQENIPEEQRSRSFSHKGKWARFWIVFGGPLANFIMAYAIYSALLFVGEERPEIKIGALPTTSTMYQKGLRPGDVVKRVNNHEVEDYTDIILDSEKTIKTITVQRGASSLRLNINYPVKKFSSELSRGSFQLRLPAVVNNKGDSYIISYSESSFDLNLSIEEMIHWVPHNTASGSGSGDISKIYLFKVLKKDDNSRPIEVAPRPEQALALLEQKTSNLMESLIGQGYRSVDLIVKDVGADSPASKAGIEKGDIIARLQEKDVSSFEELKSELQKTDRKEVSLSVWRAGQIKNFTITPKLSPIPDSDKKVKLIGVYGHIQFVQTKFVKIKGKGLFSSLFLATSRTVEMMLKTLEGIKKIITNEVSFKNVGGPLAIGKVASDSFNTSLSYFFQLMALISINLGVINLFPIPVLDGGHIMFIFMEIINRGPLSRRKMEVAQQLGLSLLLMLMVGAIFNDVTRFF